MSDDLLKDPLPEPWTFGVTKDGRVFFINDDEKRTTWLHPETGQPAMTGFQRTIDLPSGWEQAYIPDGNSYFINHNDQTTTLKHPTKPSTTAEVDDLTTKRQKRRSSFSETLTKPLFRRSSSKAKSKPEKSQHKERKSSLVRKSSFSGSKGLKTMVVQRDTNATVTRSGWLYKQDSSGVGGVKIWRKRWFVLTDFCLFYYKDAKEDDVLGSIVLPSYIITTVNPDEKINRKYVFKIEHPGMRTYYICAESYNEMAEWVRVLTPLCAFQPRTSKKIHQKSPATKENVNKPTDEDVEFGFGEARETTPKDEEQKHETSSTSSVQDIAPIVVNGNNTNAKQSTSSTSTPTAQLPRQPNKGTTNQGRSLSSASSRTPNSTTPSSGYLPRRQSSQSSKEASKSSYEHGPSYHNGDSYSDLSAPEHRRTTLPNNKVERNDSMAKLGNWVHSKRKQNSFNTGRDPNTFDSVSEANYSGKGGYVRHPRPQSGPQRISTAGKRYKPGHYNDYMDPTEVASSIMSVPPMYHSRDMSQPRPRSIQDMNDKRSQRRRTSNSKGDGRHEMTRTNRKSLERNSPSDRQSDSSYNRTPDPTAGRRYDDVFSPASNGYRDDKQFNYPAGLSPTSPNANYEIKQMDVKGKKGQLRAFAISVKPTPNNSPAKTKQDISNKLESAKLDDSDIELMLKKLQEFDEMLQQFTEQVDNLQHDKRRLRRSLEKAKSNFNSDGKSEFELGQKLSKVKTQLAKSTLKVKDASKKNDSFEREVRKLKARILEDLKNGSKFETKADRRQAEWELGRAEVILEGVGKNRVEFANLIESLRGETQEFNQTPPNSGRSSLNARSHDLAMRSPRDVKRVSVERRSPGITLHVRAPSSSSSVSQDGKYHTLPGHGVSRGSSVDSLTAASLAQYSRPLGGRTNLQRTKSAAERLLSGSQGNLSSSQDPMEIKRIQREIYQNRRRTLTGDFASNSRTLPRSFMRNNAPMPVGIDVQMAIKHHRMPKVLQRAKREMQKAEAERQPVHHDYEYGFDIDRFEADATNNPQRGRVTSDDIMDDEVPSSPHKEEDLEPDEVLVDLNLNHQLIAPDKVEIPDRLVEYEDIELSPEQERLKQKKIRAIENMLSRSGQQASRPTVHLAASLAAEAGSVARAVAYQAQSKSINPSLV